MFKQNEKVICINDKLPAGISAEQNKKAFPNWIKEGVIYTIRSNSGNHISVLLNELKNPSIFIPVMGGKIEGRFKSERFRKMELSETTVEEVIEEMQTEEDLIKI